MYDHRSDGWTARCGRQLYAGNLSIAELQSGGRMMRPDLHRCVFCEDLYILKKQIQGEGARRGFACIRVNQRSAVSDGEIAL